VNGKWLAAIFLMIAPSFIQAADTDVVSVPMRLVSSNYTEIREHAEPAYRLELAVHVDCGVDEKKFRFEGNSEDVGRVHQKRTFVQASDRSGFGGFQGKYFSYTVPLQNTGDYLLRFSDADNATRYFAVVLENTIRYEVRHALNTSVENPGDWKDFWFLVPAKAVRNGSLCIRFDHRDFEEYPPAVSDIWIYRITGKE
jgi:hypothetical protein